MEMSYYKKSFNPQKGESLSTAIKNYKAKHYVVTIDIALLLSVTSSKLL